tara:strand:- start:14795 stop:15664 length:870 start_codon:yes stop_codon:yes gene_type:complete
MKNITNETFGKSKAIHSPTDMTIKNMLTSSYGSYIESTDENDKTPSVRRRVRWENCQNQIRNYLEPLIDLSEMRWAYPTNGIHESIDWMCTKVKKYQVFEGEYRYPTFMKKPVHVAMSVNDLQIGVPLYMSNPFSATGNFDRRYDEVGSRQICPIYLDLAFVGTTGQYRLNLYENVKEIFWSCSKPYGLGLLRAGVRFVREAELIQQELQGVGYFNHAIIDVFRAVTMNSSVFAKKEEYSEKQNLICKHFNLTPSDSYLIGTTDDKEWDRFKRENGINRVCLTQAYERI